jgi:hypothetical protein
MIDPSRLAIALRNGFDAFRTARASDQRGADLSQWGLLSSVLAKIAKDTTDKRRRLWRVKAPAIVSMAAAACTIWIFLLRETVPEDERAVADMFALIGAFVISNIFGLCVRWRLDHRIARARIQIGRSLAATDSLGTPFDPQHILIADGVTVAAIDPERRLIRVIAPVFFGFDVVAPVDVRFRNARLTQPRLVELGAIANMPKVSTDVHVASTLLIFVDGTANPARFSIAEEDRRSARDGLTRSEPGCAMILAGRTMRPPPILVLTGRDDAYGFAVLKLAASA